jgi:hypothetical protein
VARLGDVRPSRIRSVFPLRVKPVSFWTELFGGVAVLRPARSSRGQRVSLVVLPPEVDAPDLGPTIRFVAGDDPQLLDSLHQYKMLEYDPTLVPRRMAELEDMLLAQHGIQAASLTAAQRRSRLGSLRADLPEVWRELRQVLKVGQDGKAAARRFIRGMSPELRLKLSAPRQGYEAADWVLATLDESDSARLLSCRPARFLSLLAKAAPAERALMELRLSDSAQEDV